MHNKQKTHYHDDNLFVKNYKYISTLRIVFISSSAACLFVFLFILKTSSIERKSGGFVQDSQLSGNRSLPIVVASSSNLNQGYVKC